MEYWLTFDGKKNSAEDKSEKKKAQSVILKSFKGKLIADFRHMNANIQVLHSAGKNFKGGRQ